MNKIQEKLTNLIELPLIAITGSGGKTTTMKTLAKAYKELGKKVLITTSTKIAHPVNYDYEYDHFTVDFNDEKLLNPKEKTITLYANSFEKFKLKSPDLDQITKLSNLYDVVIYEADGSRRLPLKIHSQRDPVIIKNTTCNIQLIGLTSYNKKLEDVMFLHSRYKELTNDNSKVFDYNVFKKLYDHKEGIRKNSDGIQEILVFNQADILPKNSLESFIKELDNDKIKAIVLSYDKDKIYREF